MLKFSKNTRDAFISISDDFRMMVAEWREMPNRKIRKWIMAILNIMLMPLYIVLLPILIPSRVKMLKKLEEVRKMVEEL